jgi:hypothetical protein
MKEAVVEMNGELLLLTLSRSLSGRHATISLLSTYFEYKHALALP